MRIAITGASGLVGKELGKELVKAGHEIVVLARPSSNAKSFRFPFPCECLAWDAAKDTSLPRELWDRPVDAFVHLAGESIVGKRWSKEWKQKLWNSRVAGARAITNSINELPEVKRPRVVVTASAIGIYGDSGESKVDESSTLGEDYLAELCQAWESEFSSSLPGAIRFCAVRVGLVLSESGGLLEKLSPIFRAGLGGRLGNGKQWMSWIHLTDLVNLFKAAIERAEYVGAINGVSPNPEKNSQFTKLMADALGRLALFPVPYLALRVAKGEFAKFILTSQRVLPSKAEQLGFHFKFSSIDSAFDNIFREKEGDLIYIAEQWVPKPREEIFLFFADEKNLEAITPPWLNFRVLDKSTAELAKGTEIRYSLRVHGIPLRWRTKIVEWSPTAEFVDNQESGPYAKWHHHHLFEPLAEGTLIRDYIRYRLPLGRMGEIIACAFVRNDIRTIFDYRQKIIEKLLNS